MVVWIVVGLAIFVDGLNGAWDFPMRFFGFLLLLEALVSLAAAAGGIAIYPWIRYARGIAMLVIALLIILPWADRRFRPGDPVRPVLRRRRPVPDHGRLGRALPGWRASLGGGIVQLLIAIFFIEPWPTWYAGTVPYATGVALLLSGWSVLWLGMRLRTLPEHTSLGMLFARGHYLGSRELAERAAERGRPSGEVLTVHVWTTRGTAIDPVDRPLVDRHIAAVDKKGVISTGHSALEILPDIYISHYPKDEIDHSPTEFTAMLRATDENDVRGRFPPSYAIESQEWGQSTEKFHFYYFDGERVGGSGRSTARTIPAT